MKQPIHLTIEKEVYKKLKRKRVNISNYVEKLIVKDFINNGLKANKKELRVQSESGSNPGVAIFNKNL